MSVKNSKKFIINELLHKGYQDDLENPLEKMSFTQLIQFRKNFSMKILEDSGTEITDEIKSMSKVELDEKIKEKHVHVTPSITGLFSSF